MTVVENKMILQIQNQLRITVTLNPLNRNSVRPERMGSQGVE